MPVDSGRFAARLKELREKAGLSQKALAEKAGLSQRAISHWEQGLREPGWSNVVAMAEVLGVDCRAFTEPSAEATATPRGRPPKVKPDDAAAVTRAKKAGRKKGT